MRVKHFVIIFFLTGLIPVETAPLIRVTTIAQMSERVPLSARPIRQVQQDDDSTNPFEFLFHRNSNGALTQLDGDESIDIEVEIMGGKKKGKGDFVELMYPARITEKVLRRFAHIIKYLFLERTLDDGVIVTQQIWSSMKQAVNIYNKRQVFEEDSNVFHDIGVIVDFTHRVAQRRLSCFKFAIGKVAKNTQYHLSNGDTVDDIKLIPPSVRVKKFLNTYLLPGEIRQDIAVTPSKYGLDVTAITFDQGEDGEIQDTFDYTIPDFLSSIDGAFDVFF